MAAGDEVLVLLVAAARDARSSEQFAFGHGRHRCPATTLAATMAEHALAPLIGRGDDQLPRPTGFVPSRNIRIPTFGDGEVGRRSIR
jgi:cytochrome P450